MAARTLPSSPGGVGLPHTPPEAELQPPDGERMNSSGATESVTPRVSHTCILCIFHLDPHFLIHSADAQRAPHTPSPPDLQQPPCTMSSKLAPGQGKPTAGQTRFRAAEIKFLQQRWLVSQRTNSSF